MTVTVLLFVGAALASAQVPAPSPLLTQPVDKLIAVLKSDASQKEKADACRELSVIGAKEAIAPLAALLGDEKLSHMARYGLEPIPSPAVDDALRQALDTLKGRPLIGVIGSIGVRRDVKAIVPLTKLLQDADPAVAQASARALGKIGTVAAANAIEGALPNTPATNRLAFCEGLFRCAEALAANGDRKEALAIYQHLRSTTGLHQVRAGALRGTILTSQKEGVPLLLEALRGDDFILVDAAARTALEMPGRDVTKALAAEFSKLDANKQILLAQTLGKRGDAGALPALMAATKAGPKAVRVAAIRAIPEIKPATPAIGVLQDLLGDADPEIAQAARDSLGGLPGPEVDKAVMAMLNKGDTAQRLAAIDLSARRRMSAALPALLKASSDSDPQVRAGALKRLGELAGPADLAVLLDLLKQAKSAEDLDSAEQALSMVCTKAPSPDACVDKLSAPLANAEPAQKGALLRVLCATGGTKALQAVRAAADDPKVRTAAIRALGKWETTDAAPDLLALAQNANDPTDKMLCLRGYLGLAAHPDLGPEQRLTMCKQASALVQKDQEKKLLLAALGGINSTDSLTVIAPYLDDPATKEEASAASVAIAEKLLKGRDISKVAPKVIPTLEKVAQVTSNPEMAKRAKTLLQQARPGA